MSLLESINRRNQEAAEQAASERAAVEAEAAKPDAEELATQQRSSYSSMLSSGEDTELTDEAVTQEEQEKFSELEMDVVRLVNGPRVQQLFKIIDSAADPVEGIGQAAHDIIKLIEQEKPGNDDEVLMAVGESAVEQLVEAYEEVNPNVDLTEDQVAEAFSIGLREYMENTQGAVDPDMRDYLASEAPQQLPEGIQ